MSELPVGAVIAGLTIRGTAGRGGMGVVYRAFDPNLHRSVALKVIAPDLAADSEFRERFRRESRSAAAVDHPHIIGIHAAGEDAGLLYLAMRYVDGTDLKQLIRARGRLDPLLATTIVGQIAAALDAAHRRGLVHRDVKPANVLVDMTDGRPHAYLTDFGLTRPIGPGEQITRTGVLMGTFEYMAPELFNGAPAGVASDIYALGCVLHHALSGDAPYRHKDLVPMIAAHMSAAPPGLGDAVADPALRSALEQVIATALAKQPEARQPSAGTLGSAAQAAVAQARRADTLLRGGVAAATVDVPVPQAPVPDPPTVAAPPEPPTEDWAAGPRPAGPVYTPPPGSSPAPSVASGGPAWSGPAWAPASPSGSGGSDVPTWQGPLWAPPGSSVPPPQNGSEAPAWSGPVWAPPGSPTPSPQAGFDSPAGSGPSWPPPYRRDAEPAPAQPTPRRRAPLVLVAAVAVAVVGAGAVTWYTTVGSSPAAANGTSTTATPAAAAADIELAVPIDKTDSVTLTWTGPPGLDYGVDIAADGQPAATTDVHRVTTWTTPVEPGKKYCFQVRGTDGRQLYPSNIRALRGATCANG